MSKDSLEHISSLMDGELSHETSLFVARRMGSDEDLGRTWARYHLVRECLRSPGGKWALTGLSLNLGAIDDSSDFATERPETGVPGWLRPVAGLAIAASVAAVAVFLAVPNAFQPIGQPSPGTEPFTSPNPLTVAPASQAASYNGAQSAANRRLNTLLLRHNQAVGAVGAKGFVSFVPIVTAAPVKVMDPEDLPPKEAAGDTEAKSADQP